MKNNKRKPQETNKLYPKEYKQPRNNQTDPETNTTPTMNFPKLQNSTTTQFPPNFTKPLKFHKKPTIPKQALTEISKI